MKPTKPSRKRCRSLSLSLLLLEVAECIDNLVVQFLVELLPENIVRLTWQLKLHVGELLNEHSQLAADCAPRDLVITRALSDCFLRTVVEGDDAFHHADRLGKRGQEIIFTVAILLQEIFADNPGHVEGNLLIFGKGIFPNELHNFLQIILLLQDLLHASLEMAILWVEI